MESLKKLKVTCIQYDPKLEEVEANIVTLKNLVKTNTEKLEGSDIIVLPEMSLTGYEYESRKSIAKFCEIENSSSQERFKEYLNSPNSLNFASELALSFDAYVMIGFPEVCPMVDYENKITNLETLIQYSNFYNSAYLIDRKGTKQKVFRKHFLYETDKVRKALIFF